MYAASPKQPKATGLRESSAYYKLHLCLFLTVICVFVFSSLADLDSLRTELFAVSELTVICIRKIGKLSISIVS